jgi:CheY-like chemotaxis protein
LTAILTNLELLSRPSSSNIDRQQRLIGGARSAAERGAKLTRQLLAFARQQRIVAEPTNVNAVVEDMRSILWSTLGRGIEITIAVEPDLPAAQADATQLQLAVLNLAINARDASGPGGRLTITTASEIVGAPSRPEEPTAGRYVVVAVGDNGSGIDDAVRERIFEPFFTTKSLGHGSGLGLAQVLGIMKQLGGGVNVRTSLNEGSTIRLLMPVADAQAAPLASPPLGEAVTKSKPNRRILLVDDDADVRSAAAAALREAGHYVVDAESGSTAWDALVKASGRFDLIVADVVMPGMSGTELAAKARLTWPELRVLFVTGFADLGKLPAELWSGVLPKPFRPAELEARVAEAMSSIDDRA